LVKQRPFLLAQSHAVRLTKQAGVAKQPCCKLNPLVGRGASKHELWLHAHGVCRVGDCHSESRVKARGRAGRWRSRRRTGSQLWLWLLHVWLAENQGGTAAPNQKVRAAVLEDPARLVARTEPNVVFRSKPLANGHKIFLVPACVAASTVRVAFGVCNERDTTCGC